MRMQHTDTYRYVRTYAYAYARMRGGCAHAQKNVKSFYNYYIMVTQCSPVMVIEKQKGKKKERRKRVGEN